MPHYAEHDDVFTTNGQFLSTHAPRGSSSSSRQSISLRKSSASLRANEFGGGNDDTGGRHHSLAHELAVALMPEPSAGSKLLAEEFGIEFDEGAEVHADHASDHDQLNSASEGGLSFADELGAHDSFDGSFGGGDDLATALGASATDGADESPSNTDLDPVFDSPSAPRTKPRQRTPEKDAMDVLSENLEFTDKFLTQLRTLDSDTGASGSSSQQHQPKLEKLASDVIRKINESVKDREGQVRALFDCEREFRKISGEVGGTDVLGQLDELEQIEDLTDGPSPATNTVPSPPQQHYQPRSLKTLVEEDQSHDWELDPDRGHHLGDYEDSEPSTTPIRTTFAAPSAPSLTGPPTPAKLVPQLTYIRTLTSGTISSLTSLSEHSQVNGVATADAARKIRSLKNKLGSWKAEWESAEKSMGIVDPVDGSESSVPPTPTKLQTMRRVDGRKIVAEQLQAFERALADAALKTQAIMAQ
ncbi:hypothetical protein FA13DRAFT_1727112 [Coprinellus micaceus]|uniref:Uncharacterized protein n=1 Tax=Coprinellus micaceus TaxID=71717 RepID=A0A4Y7TRE8_COPMI|nr:hypothetical protein FA13DRAFT_1727112 [Coprinellus micaceus]